MKYILFLIGFIFLSNAALAQKSDFLRVFDYSGNKIHKGRFASATDSTLEIKHKKSLITIPLNDIGKIRTKRSGGHNILVGTIFGAAYGIGIGAAWTSESDKNNRPENMVKGALVFAYGIGALSAATILLKKSHTFFISENASDWNDFRDFMVMQNIRRGVTK